MDLEGPQISGPLILGPLRSWDPLRSRVGTPNDPFWTPFWTPFGPLLGPLGPLWGAQRGSTGGSRGSQWAPPFKGPIWVPHGTPWCSMRSHGALLGPFDPMGPGPEGPPKGGPKRGVLKWPILDLLGPRVPARPYRYPRELTPISGFGPFLDHFLVHFWTPKSAILGVNL